MEQIDKVADEPKKISKVKGSLFKAGGWFRRHLAFTITLIVVAVLFVGSLIFTAVYYRDKAAPGTTIASINVGGQTKEQIVESVEGLLSNMRLSLTYGGKSATASAKDLGINLDAEDIASEAVATGQHNSFAVVFSQKHFDLTGSYSEDKVKEFVNSNFPELTTDPKDATVVYDSNQNRYVVQSGAVGKSVQIEKLYAQVEKLLDNPQLTSYEIATIDDEPAISDEAAQAAADEANLTLSQTIQIVNDGQVIWSIDPWTIADWITFTATEPTTVGTISKDDGGTAFTTSTESGTYEISYDKDKIKDFVNNSVVSQLTNRPVNQVAITDSDNNVLQVISAGQDGKVASNVDAVVDQIHEYVESARSGQIALKTKDAAYGTTATQATGSTNKWIEYNLSTFTVTLHEGNNVYWTTSRTSRGKSDTPTITGLYKVIRKANDVCMPNPPSSEPLCNIHWVTYWEASGYAFHEAWWMDYSKGNVNAGISHGCINMFIDDAKVVYDFADIGTPVWTHW